MLKHTFNAKIMQKRRRNDKHRFL